MPPIRLIATDLDGTLIGPDDNPDLYIPYREAVNRFRRTHNAIWVVCTGRRLSSYRRAFMLMEHWGIVPDFVIARHAYIYSVVRGRYIPHFLWNFRMRARIRAQRRSMHRLLREWHGLLLSRFDHVQTVALERKRLCLQFSRPREAEEAARFLRERARGHTLLSVFRYQGEVDVRVVPFTKGLAVNQLAQRVGVPRELILAIGDGHNDLALMDPEFVGNVGCPENATHEIIELVHNRGGHVARGSGIEGVMETLRAYETDSVNSRLPEGFRSAEDGANPVRIKPPRTSPGDSRHARHRGRERLRAAFLIGSAAYITLLAFANFGIIPGSSVVMWPFHQLMKLAHYIADRLA